MVTKQELRRIRQTRAGLREIKYHIRELTETIGGLKAQQITGMPKHGGCTSALEESVIQLNELQMYYAGKILSWYSEVRRIERAMQGIDEIEATAIRMYYFHGLTWEQVADRMNYTRDGINKIHGRAIDKLSQDKTVH